MAGMCHAREDILPKRQRILIPARHSDVDLRVQADARAAIGCVDESLSEIGQGPDDED